MLNHPEDGDGGSEAGDADAGSVPFVSVRRPGTARDDHDDDRDAAPRFAEVSRGGGRRRDRRRDEENAAAAAAPAPTASSKDEAARRGNPVRVLPAGEHDVTRELIGRSALKVLDKLHAAGFTACLVGGGVRDALVGLAPKDFDIATDASPEQVRATFRNSRIIGRRFKLVHVVFGREIIETATFRAAHDSGSGGEVADSGRIVRDNVYGTIDEDAFRRDFTVNALYWDVADGAVLDHVGGLEDIERRTFRLIGDPHVRCAEDPVRVLRAVRLSAKLGFDIDPDTLAAMRATSDELGNTAPARLFEEVLKLFQGGYARASFDAVREHGLLKLSLPGARRPARARARRRTARSSRRCCTPPSTTPTCACARASRSPPTTCSPSCCGRTSRPRRSRRRPTGCPCTRRWRTPPTRRSRCSCAPPPSRDASRGR